MTVNQNKKTLAYKREWLTKPGFTGDDFCAYVFILCKILDDLIRFGIIAKTEDGYEFLEKDTLEYNRENPDD